MPKRQQPKLEAIPNPEKIGHEKNDPKRDLIDWPRPFRWGILGAVSCGKTSLILNYLIKSRKYDNIFIIHPHTYNPNIAAEDEASNNNIVASVEGDNVIPEYDGVDYIGLAFLPSMRYFDKIAKQHNLLIIDDIDLLSYCKKRREMREERLNKLFSFVSSHKNVSIIVSSQDASSQLPSFVLKMCNVQTVYHVRDGYVIQTLARKLGMGYKRLIALLRETRNKHDAITFDNTDDTIHQLRLNIYQDLVESV